MSFRKGQLAALPNLSRPPRREVTRDLSTDLGSSDATRRHVFDVWLLDKRTQLTRLRRDAYMAVAKNMDMCEWVFGGDAASGARVLIAPLGP